MNGVSEWLPVVIAWGIVVGAWIGIRLFEMVGGG